MTDALTPSPLPRPPMPAERESDKHLRWRYTKDVLARYAVWGGGLSVIAALMLIFVYLLSEVLPMFGGLHFEERGRVELPVTQSPSLFLASEEQGEVGLQVSADGQLSFYNLHGAGLRLQQPVAGGAIGRLAEISGEQGLLAVSDLDGDIRVLKHGYRVSYPDDQRRIDPYIEYPYGESPILSLGEAPASMTVRDEGDQLAVYAVLASGEILLEVLDKASSFLSDEVSLESAGRLQFTPELRVDQLLVDPLLDWLYLIDHESGQMQFLELDGAAPPRAVQRVELGAGVIDAQFLAGGVSIIALTEDGRISQWFPARDEQGSWYLAAVREFQLDEDLQPSALGVELRRRVFAVGTRSGEVVMFHATAERELSSRQLTDFPIDAIRFAPRNDLLLLRGGEQLVAVDVENEHPEVSFSSLWSKVWYEGYTEPQYQWQSSAANADFEPKFSLTPLSFGTLKAAFYAMLFAVPLAILGAIFTANFMSPQMRQWVKPTVELMEALPTVILGFLAGLWLAPFIETHLAGVFLLLLLMPLSIPLFGYLWQLMPQRLRYLFPPGWEALLLLPVLALVTWLSFMLALPVEIFIFDGNMQGWMDRELGIGYDQRNSLVVGIAMGIAVVPTIFSITEDAIFSVPKHLSLGSLALGATPWQTLIGVVLPTASPGIFSAVMIGMGRAVGETMIVLMATGNTPVMDASIFQGMRTLSANIAVEMPESEVGSTHFRLLFLAGLVLFIFTFLFNTLAEVVRQRLRRKYASI